MSTTIHRPTTSAGAEPVTSPARRRRDRLRGVGGRISLAHGLMVVAALVTFVSVSTVLRERGAFVEVTVADRAMPVGATVTRADVRVVAVEADSPLLDRFVPIEEFRSGRLSRHVDAGHPLMIGDVGHGADEAVRSVAIELDPVTVQGLELRVGDEIDVIGSDDEQRIGFVLDGLLVLRVGSPEGSTGAFDRPSGAAFVVVRVTPAEAVELAAAQRAGSIDVVRSTGTGPLADEVDLTRPSVGEGRS